MRINTLLTAMEAYASTLLARPTQWVEDFRYKCNNLPLINTQYAERLLYQDKFKDAVFRAKVALYFDKTYQPAWYILGLALIGCDKEKEAEAALKQSLRLQPEHEESWFFLSTIHPEIIPKDKNLTTIPRRFAIDQFEKLADIYEDTQRDLGYRGHSLAVSAAREHMKQRRTNYRLLDLGCGTGLVGAMLLDTCEEIVGVDFSRTMLKHTAARRRDDERLLYSRTIHRDIRDFLDSLHQPDYIPEYDFVLAAHVFCYVGALEACIYGMANVLIDGGYAVFQVEPHPRTDIDYGIITSRKRFAHNPNYVAHLLAQAGLVIVQQQPVYVYPNVEYLQYTVQKPGQEE